jgi:hypothetical protein
MKTAAGIILIALIVIGGLYAAVQIQKDQEKEIRAWANQHEFQVLEVTKCLFDHGPFWLVGENDNVWYVKVHDPYQNKQRETYFLFPVFGEREQRWVKE